MATECVLHGAECLGLGADCRAARSQLAIESRARAEAEAREAVLREALIREAIEIVDGYWAIGLHAVKQRIGALATMPPSPVAAALVELERAARGYRDAYDRFDEDESNTSLDALNAAEKALIAAVTNLDRARAGQ